MSDSDPIEEIRRLAAERDRAAAARAEAERAVRHRAEMRAAAWRERREARIAALDDARGPHYWLLWVAALLTAVFDALYPPAELTDDDPERYAALIADRTLRVPRMRRGEDGRRLRDVARVERRPLILGGRRISGIGAIVLVVAALVLIVAIRTLAVTLL